jgi:hypothetical protein
MHADAIPDADPASLADPGDVATRIVDMIRRADGGVTRLVASAWELAL